MFLPKRHFYKNYSIDFDRMTTGSKLEHSVASSSFQDNPKDLDLSCKMDLDLWDCLGRVNLVS